MSSILERFKLDGKVAVVTGAARGLGQGIKEFKKASREVTDEIQNTTTDTPQKPAANGQSQPAPTVSQPSNPPKV